ncbi:hypothetical protein HZH68_012022 [Vespula germanica]|uniref:Uncharacterized protein n=1 Tax=Vespula germanica TaxID=30212 RepID=A0A834MYN0_VESGE|nr:hypothetical protein HZH68_012022 [Vespula germanica]
MIDCAPVLLLPPQSPPANEPARASPRPFRVAEARRERKAVRRDVEKSREEVKEEKEDEEKEEEEVVEAKEKEEEEG